MLSQNKPACVYVTVDTCSLRLRLNNEQMSHCMPPMTSAVSRYTEVIRLRICCSRIHRTVDVGAPTSF